MKGNTKMRENLLTKFSEEEIYDNSVERKMRETTKTSFLFA